MKKKMCLILISIGCTFIFAGTALGQIVVQHLGAANPVDEGFRLTSGPFTDLAPVFDDLGFDAWRIRTISHDDSASYHRVLTDEELRDAINQGWRLSANVRFVEASDFARINMQFNMGTQRFRLAVRAPVTEEIVISGDDIDPFSLELNALDYHKFDLVYDPLLESASLWVDGVKHETDIFGREVSTSMASVRFGAFGESITYSHWNEFTFEIIPEPTTVALLTGIGALLATIVRRRRKISAK